MKMQKRRAGLKERILAVILVVTMLWTMGLGNAVSAVNSEQDSDITWKIENGVLTISGNGAMDNYYDVNGDKNSYDPLTSAPWRNQEFTKVVIENGVTTIGKDAFAGCKGLTNVEIPASVTIIDKEAFACCIGLTSMDIQTGLEKIGWDSFRGCTGLVDVEIPESVKEIDRYAFHYCTGLTSVDIPMSVTEISADVFHGCTGLEKITVAANNQDYASLDGILFSKDMTAVIICPAGKKGAVTIPTSVTAIGGDAFRDCTGLTSVDIPIGVTIIGSSAFYGCTSLTSVEIPIGVTYIGSYTFWRCTGLTSVDIPSSVKIIDSGAFCGCTALTRVEVPTSVKEIRHSAFSKCTGLTSVNIPANVEEIGEEAFYGCTGLERITVAEDNEIYASLGGMLFDKDLTELIVCPAGKKGAVTIPVGVTNITDSAFCDCADMTSVEIPTSVTHIGWDVFRGCIGLTSVEIPMTVTYIGGGAFDGCTSLTSVNIPTGVEKIGTYMFYDCTSLTSVKIPAGVTNIGWYAFYNCTSLTKVEIPAGVTEIGEYAFYGCTSLTSMEIPSGVATIESCTFYGCTGLTRVEIPTSVTYISSRAFYGCTCLASVEIPEDVSGIEIEVFYGCTGLERITVATNNQDYASLDGMLFNKDMTVLFVCPGGKKGTATIPTSVTDIDENAFSNCMELERITVATNNQDFTSIDGMLFSKDMEDLLACPGGKKGTVDIPTSTKCIGRYAFCGCTEMTGVTFPTSVIYIGWYAFLDCTGLTSVEIPANVFYIGSYAFENCTSLSQITFSSVPEINYKAFAGVTATVYYDPADGWTEEQKGNYGGNLTWIEKQAHTPGEWTVTTPATYTTKGTEVRKCTVCGETLETREIPMLTLATPKISKTENAATGVKVTWGKITGAEKYRVYYRVSGTSAWSKMDVSGTTATVTKLTSGKSYNFTVKALAGNNASQSASVSTITYCAMPTVSKTENTSTGVKLTWSKVTDATKYRVYYKLSTASKYTTFKDVTGNSVTVTGLTAGKSYVFTVKAYNGSWSANKASSAVVYRPVPTVSKLTNAAKGITVTWTKISGATKYALYYKVNGASSWTRVSNTLTANSATVTGLTSGKSYVFTVKAYVGGGWSTNVSSSAIVRVNAVTISGLTNSASKIMKATWKKDTTLTGYQIQYSLKSDFSDAKTVTVKSNSTVSQTIKSLTKGKTYYVRIRGYKTVSKVTTYGAWSASKSVKISK